MLKTFSWCCALSTLLLSPAVGAATLCTAQDKSVVVSVHSASCKAEPCVVKFEAGRTAYFEFHPTGCTGASQEFSIQVAKKTGNAKPQLKSCDGNATCPSSFNQDGMTAEFTAQGKTWGRIRY